MGKKEAMVFEEMKEKFFGQAKEMFYYREKALKSDEGFSREYADKHAIAAANIWECMGIVNKNMELIPHQEFEQMHKDLLKQANDEALGNEKTAPKKQKKERTAGGR